MNKTIKILSILLIAVTLISFTSTVFADEVKLVNDMQTASKDEKAKVERTELTNTAAKIMNVIRNVAVIAGVLILMVLGVKFMLGSTAEKAEYKKSLIPLVVGIVLVMAATSIASFLFSIF